MNQQTGKPRRHPFQFSIKTILVLMLIVAAYFAGKIPEQRRAEEAEQKAYEQANKAAIAEKKALELAEVLAVRAEMAKQQAEVARHQLEVERARASLPEDAE